LSENQQADKEEYVEYRLRIPKAVHAKLHYLKVQYQFRSLNDIILMAINEFLKRHKKDLASSAKSNREARA